MGFGVWGLGFRVMTHVVEASVWVWCATLRLRGLLAEPESTAVAWVAGLGGLRV